jgi:glucose-6-phosphate-specific signal transduction histidine kinase
MQKGTETKAWLAHLAVGLAYAAIFMCVRPFSDAHWVLTAGLRLSFLLLIPYRYWPALAIGELVPQSYFSFRCLEQFGLVYTLLMCVPFTAVAMPVVWRCRERMSLFPTKRHINIGTLLVCTILVSALWAAANMGILTTLKLAPGSAPFHLSMFHAVQFFIGNYVGILSIVPLVMVVRQGAKAGHLREQSQRLLKSRLFLECVVLLIPILSLLAWVDINAKDDIKQIARMAMFLPVAWLVLKHGWRAAAFGGTVAIAYTCLTLASRPDPGILQAQAFMAFAVTCLLALGARISEQSQQEEAEQMHGQHAVMLAQQQLRLTELRMRRVAHALEHLGVSIQQSHGQLMTRLRHYSPGADERVYFRQASAAQQEVFQLADSVYPMMLRERGLTAALHRGTIARALDEAHVRYFCEFKGRGLSALSPDVHTAIYRFACEAVIYLFGQMKCSSIQLRLRGGETGGRRWAVLVVDGAADSANVSSDEVIMLDRDRLAFKLGAHALELKEIRDQARVYGGELHERKVPGARRVSILLHEIASFERVAATGIAGGFQLQVR